MRLTLYRTDRESPVVHALLDAVRRGKQVRVLVELNARLDEHRNVNWWRMLGQAGASVFPSPAGLKVHAKMALIERHEAGRLRRYAHLSSGNYNAFTARAYTDIALLTCDDDIDRRVEVMAPLKDAGLRRRMFEILPSITTIRCEYCENWRSAEVGPLTQEIASLVYFTPHAATPTG